MQIVNLGFLCIIPFLFLIFVAIPEIWNFRIYKKTFKCFKKCGKGIRNLVKAGVIWVTRLFRKHICLCWKYYDPYIVVNNRPALFIHAAVASKSIKISKRSSKRVFTYLNAN